MDKLDLQIRELLDKQYSVRQIEKEISRARSTIIGRIKKNKWEYTHPNRNKSNPCNLNKLQLEQYCNDGLTIREMANELNVVYSTVRAYLNKYNLKTSYMRGKTKATLYRKKYNYYCKTCGCTDSTMFYPNQKYRCKKCVNQRTIEVGRETAVKIRTYYGNKCLICGYNKYQCSLDLHHIDPNTKDINYSNIRYWKWERILKELEKCILVCRNCHQAIHCNELEYNFKAD